MKKLGVLSIIIIFQVVFVISIVNAFCSNMSNSAFIQADLLKSKGLDVKLSESDNINVGDYFLWASGTFYRLDSIDNVDGFNNDIIKLNKIEKFYANGKFSEVNSKLVLKPSGEGVINLFVDGFDMKINYYDNHITIDYPTDYEDFSMCVPTYCSETDNGKDFDNRGITIEYDNVGNSINETDECVNMGGVKEIAEYYCGSSNKISVTYHKCGDDLDCNNGVCVGCIDRWVCTSLGKCEDGYRNRTCEEINNCPRSDNKPPLIFKCGKEKEDVPVENIIEEVDKCPEVEVQCPEGTEPDYDYDNSGCHTGTRCMKKMSNGANSEVKLMPERASETAIAMLGIHVCSEENNCEIELKEVGKLNEMKMVYEVKAEKPGKFLGLIKTRLRVMARIDAETGKVEYTKKPWYSFLVSEKDLF